MHARRHLSHTIGTTRGEHKQAYIGFRTGSAQRKSREVSRRRCSPCRGVAAPRWGRCCRTPRKSEGATAGQRTETPVSASRVWYCKLVELAIAVSVLPTCRVELINLYIPARQNIALKQYLRAPHVVWSVASQASCQRSCSDCDMSRSCSLKIDWPPTHVTYSQAYRHRHQIHMKYGLHLPGSPALSCCQETSSAAPS